MEDEQKIRILSKKYGYWTKKELLDKIKLLYKNKLLYKHQNIIQKIWKMNKKYERSISTQRAESIKKRIPMNPPIVLDPVPIVPKIDLLSLKSIFIHQIWSLTI